MSIEQARKYFERVISDEEFWNRILEVKSIEERMAIINAEGFDCTIQELLEVSQQSQNNEVFMHRYQPVYGIACKKPQENK